MQRYTADHRAGRSGRDAALVDEAGRRVLGLSGAWAVTDGEGRTTLFVSPDFGGIVKGSIVSGLLDGVVGGVIGVDDTGSHDSRNPGEGVQTIKRAKRPVRGVPFQWTPVATVRRERSEAGVPPRYLIEPHEAGLPPVRFVQEVGGESLAGYRNGFADPRFGVYDLVHEVGRPIVRHWATIDDRGALVGSVFDVADPDAPLAEAVILCLARHVSSRT